MRSLACQPVNLRRCQLLLSEQCIAGILLAYSLQSASG
jgi:hypothetical protein